jgi:hypothetical protein
MSADRFLFAMVEAGLVDVEIGQDGVERFSPSAAARDAMREDDDAAARGARVSDGDDDPDDDDELEEPDDDEDEDDEDDGFVDDLEAAHEPELVEV